MPKMQVYLPADLYARMKARRRSLNVSQILQAALEEALAVLDRRDAADEAIRSYEAEFGAFTAAELAAQEARDRAASRRPLARRRKPKKKAA